MTSAQTLAIRLLEDDEVDWSAPADEQLQASVSVTGTEALARLGFKYDGSVSFTHRWVYTETIGSYRYQIDVSRYITGYTNLTVRTVLGQIVDLGETFDLECVICVVGYPAELKDAKFVAISPKEHRSVDLRVAEDASLAKSCLRRSPLDTWLLLRGAPWTGKVSFCQERDLINNA